MSKQKPECTVASNGKHCWHNPSSYWEQQRSQICCWCGKTIQLHGDFLPLYNGFVNANIPNSATTTWTNTWPTHNTTGTYWVNMTSSGSVGSGG